MPRHHYDNKVLDLTTPPSGSPGSPHTYASPGSMAVSWMEEVACGPALIALRYQSYLSPWLKAFLLPPSVWLGLPLLSPLSVAISYALFLPTLIRAFYLYANIFFFWGAGDKVFLECGVSKSTLLNNTGGGQFWIGLALVLCARHCCSGVYWGRGVDYWLSIFWPGSSETALKGS